jgi:hypothetical protein
VYVHQELDGIVYQEMPQPSIPFNSSSLASFYGYTHGHVLSSSGHLRVSITAERAKVEYVRAIRPRDEDGDSSRNGQVDAEYFIKPSLGS